MKPMKITTAWGVYNDSWCENVIQWLRKLRLAQQFEDVKHQIDLRAVLNALDEINTPVENRLEETENLETCLQTTGMQAAQNEHIDSHSHQCEP
eukprot:5264400-Amphidinium_carterae.1